jgi:PP-loop superfamily ATP-utilizing enzyme
MTTVISYGGGVQSTALVILAMRQQWPVDEIVHVDLLAAESPSTREYVKYFHNWLRDEYGREITFIERDLYGDMLANPAFTPVPWLGKRERFMLRRQCTREYKVAPVQRYLTQKYLHGRIQLMLGISADEWHRMRQSSHSRIDHVYPLIDLMITRTQCLEIIQGAGLDIPSKSSCWFCPFRSQRSQRELVKQYPHLAGMARELEQRINSTRVERGKPEIAVIRSYDFGQQDFCEEGFCDT